MDIWYENESQFATLTDNTIEQLMLCGQMSRVLKGSYSELISRKNEEAQRCYAGIRTQQETTAQIQLRVSFYLTEQHG